MKVLSRARCSDDDISKLFPVVEPDCSDSGTFDNVLEFLLMTGRTLARGGHDDDSRRRGRITRVDVRKSKRAFYEYHSCLMEPWDGPASIVFTDGHYIGAVLDRNGLRPSRYYLTHRRSGHHGQRSWCAASRSESGQEERPFAAWQDLP